MITRIKRCLWRLSDAIQSTIFGVELGVLCALIVWGALRGY